jgi:hypothetical protein
MGLQLDLYVSLFVFDPSHTWENGAIYDLHVRAEMSFIFGRSNRMARRYRRPASQKGALV